jgi:hypothetical protein
MPAQMPALFPNNQRHSKNDAAKAKSLEILFARKKKGG